MSNFKLNDTIYFVKNNKIEKRKIEGISKYQGKIKELHFDKEIEEDTELVLYHCGMYTTVEENEAFSSLDDLKEFLFKDLK